MIGIFNLIFHPVDSLDRWLDDEGDGIDWKYPLALFFAWGIWLVVHRYQKKHNSALPFEVNAPAVCYNSLLLMNLLHFDANFIGSGSQLGITIHNQRQFEFTLGQPRFVTGVPPGRQEIHHELRPIDRTSPWHIPS